MMIFLHVLMYTNQWIDDFSPPVVVYGRASVRQNESINKEKRCSIHSSWTSILHNKNILRIRSNIRSWTKKKKLLSLINETQIQTLNETLVVRSVCLSLKPDLTAVAKEFPTTFTTKFTTWSTTEALDKLWVGWLYNFSYRFIHILCISLE